MKVTCLMAITLDGKIAKDSDHFPDWTEKADKQLFMEITKKARVIIMGSKTYDTLKKPLSGRKNIVITRNKDRISSHKNLIYTNEPPKKILETLQKEGYEEVILIGGTIINTLFAKEKLINEIIVTISPIIFGKGLSLFNPEIAMKLTLEKVKPLGTNSIYAKYKVAT